jgi:hypothetical protein
MHESRPTAPLMSPVLHPLHKPRLVHHWRLVMALVLLSHHAVPRSPTPSTAQRFAADIDALSTLLIGSSPASPLPAPSPMLKSPHSYLGSTEPPRYAPRFPPSRLVQHLPSVPIRLRPISSHGGCPTTLNEMGFCQQGKTNWLPFRPRRHNCVLTNHTQPFTYIRFVYSGGDDYYCILKKLY